MTPMQTATEHGGKQGDGRMVYRVHFLSQVDDSRCESADILAYRLERVDSRTVNADGVMIQFQSDIAEIAAAEQ